MSVDFTYNLETPVGQVRLRIKDKDGKNPIFTDQELTYFLTAEGDNVALAAALALETMAADPLLLSKRIRLPDYEVDQSTAGKGLLDVAKAIRQRVAEEADEGALDIAEWVVDDFTYRQRLQNEVLRGQ